MKSNISLLDYENKYHIIKNVIPFLESCHPKYDTDFARKIENKNGIELLKFYGRSPATPPTRR